MFLAMGVLMLAGEDEAADVVALEDEPPRAAASPELPAGGSRTDERGADETGGAGE